MYPSKESSSGNNRNDRRGDLSSESLYIDGY